MKRKIKLEAEHLPGHLNRVVDEESRMMKDRWDWKLHLMIFREINNIWGPLEIDLFASRTTKQLPRFFSWRPDPQAEGTDAFKHHWKQPTFANPPWALIPRTLSEVRTQGAMVVLVAPVWKAQAWYPVMLSLLFNTSTRNNSCTNPPISASIQWSGCPTGRVALIRRSCQEAELSEKATRLLMASWRSKSQSFYTHFSQVGVLVSLKG